jgi:hypothetical protein
MSVQIVGVKQVDGKLSPVVSSSINGRGNWITERVQMNCCKSILWKRINHTTNEVVESSGWDLFHSSGVCILCSKMTKNLSNIRKTISVPVVDKTGPSLTEDQIRILSNAFAAS